MKKKIIGAVVMMGLLAGCASNGGNSEASAETKAKPTSYETLVENEMYYIKHEDKEEFASRYGQFRKDHPELKVVEMQEDHKYSKYNLVKGHFVFTEKKGEN